MKEEHNLTSNGSPNISHTSFSPFQPIVNQMDLDVAQEEFWSLDIDDDDVGYSDFRAGLDGDDGTFDGEARATSSPKKGIHVRNLPILCYDNVWVRVQNSVEFWPTVKPMLWRTLFFSRLYEFSTSKP